MKVETEINWDKFTDPECTRFAMGSPVVIAGVKYATNTRIAIAVPCDEPDTDLGDKRFPNVMPMFDFRHITIWEPWEVKIPVCSKCRGTELQQCTRCCGRKVRQCDMDHTHECDWCEGEGTERCEGCSDVDSAIQIGRHKIALWLCKLIDSLPRPITWASLSAEDPLFFRFGENGRGCVMGMRK